ncbi:MAG TPA: hypothetical protein PLW50_01100 [Smithellaceae bacterium]|jgi:hypothetical protein|nr:hypothetical protein [Smithellaceae bacterium]
MAHFYAEIQGARGEATRCGDKHSGINGHIRGWDIGASVRLHYDEKTGLDTCRIFLTSGSNGNHASVCLGEFTSEAFTKPVEVPLVRPLTVLKKAEKGVD